MLLHDMIERNVQTNGQGQATQFRGRSHTWSQFAERIARLGHGLESLGVEPGARVAILAHNSDRYTECLFGVARAGAVFVPVNTRLAPAEIVYWLADSDSALLCVDDDFVPLLPALRSELPSLRDVLYIGEQPAPPAGTIGLDALIEASRDGDAVARAPDDLVGLFYTGGTTGKSKGVMLSHRNLIANAFNLLPVFGIDDKTRYLHAAPMFHIADNAGGFATALAGAANSYVPKFDPVAVMTAIQEQRITHAVLVPTMINILVNHPELARFDLSSLRTLTYGGSPMPEAVARKTIEMLPHVRLLQAYGQTEAAPCLTFNTHEFHALSGPLAAKLRSAGRSAYGVQLRILDADGREAPRGTVGEICARGDVVMQGYWNKPEQTAEALRDGWLHTGDSGTMDEDGFVYIVDRVKDMIISGGENVYSVEVEEALYQHPAIAECAVIGIPDENWGEAVHAIVRVRDGRSVDKAELMAHCRGRIAGFKCPRSIEIRAEPMPLSGAGKILKSELRKPFWQGRSRQVN
jgi:long-chain acyl-CoA synthetase